MEHNTSVLNITDSARVCQRTQVGHCQNYICELVFHLPVIKLINTQSSQLHATAKNKMQFNFPNMRYDVPPAKPHLHFPKGGAGEGSFKS